MYMYIVRVHIKVAYMYIIITVGVWSGGWRGGGGGVLSLSP